MLQLYARCQCLPENGSCRWKVVVVVVSRQRLVTETWKALTWSTNRHSSASHAQTRLPHLNHTSAGGGGMRLFVRERASVSLKCSTFHWPEDTRFLCAVETTCGGGSTIHSISTPLYRSPFFFFSLPISPLWWCDISLLGHQISQSHLGDTSLTSWLLYLLNWEKFPLI